MKVIEDGGRKYRILQSNEKPDFKKGDQFSSCENDTVWYRTFHSGDTTVKTLILKRPDLYFQFRRPLV